MTKTRIHTHTETEKNKSESIAVYDSYRHFQKLVMGGSLLVLVLGFTYLIALNSIATRGFALEQIKADRITIVKRLEQVEIQSAIPLSLYALQSSSQIQNMEMVEKKQYLHIENGRVAIR